MVNISTCDYNAIETVIRDKHTLTFIPDIIVSSIQFWNCAEIRISSDCASEPPPPSPPTAPPPQTTTQATTTTTTQSTGTTTTTTTSSTTSVSPPPPPAPSSCPAENNACGPNNPCSNGMCCSQWGYCGTTEGYCGECCQSNCDGQPPSPPSPSPPTPSPPTSNPPPSPPGFNYNAEHGEDSRLIAYVGNWQACPTDEQIDAYSHIVIAFAVSYTWSPTKNNCDDQCQVPSSLPLCGNQARPDLIEKWRGMGKKVIMSFGGAGMGGSWSGEFNGM